MELLIWTILGYIAMPTIFVVGLALTALFACVVMDILDLETLDYY